MAARRSKDEIITALKAKVAYHENYIAKLNAQIEAAQAPRTRTRKTSICNMSELDPKYADVIVNRYISRVGTDEGVYLLREGDRIPHSLIIASKEDDRR